MRNRDLRVVYTNDHEKTVTHYRKNYPFYCAERGDLRAIKRLIRKGFDPKTVDESWGWTILGWSARHGHLKVVKYLLSLNIDGLVDHRHINTTRWFVTEGIRDPLATPLALACEMYRHAVYKRSKRHSPRKVHDTYFKIAKLLIDHGADIHDRDMIGYGPYSRALIADPRNERIVTMLRDLGCGEDDLYKGYVEYQIEDFIRTECDFKNIEEIVDLYSPNDTIATWLIRKYWEQRNYRRCDKEGKYSWSRTWDEWDEEELQRYEKIVKYLIDHNKSVIQRRRA